MTASHLTPTTDSRGSSMARPTARAGRLTIAALAAAAHEAGAVHRTGELAALIERVAR